MPGDAVVTDDPPAHVAPGVVGAAGAALRYPPYSPDRDPIEDLRGKAKAALRAAGARTPDASGEATDQAPAALTPDDCRGFFGNGGYLAL